MLAGKVISDRFVEFYYRKNCKMPNYNKIFRILFFLVFAVCQGKKIQSLIQKLIIKQLIIDLLRCWNMMGCSLTLILSETLLFVSLEWLVLHVSATLILTPISDRSFKSSEILMDTSEFCIEAFLLVFIKHV